MLVIAHRLLAGAAATFLLVSALALPEPSPDCLEWCALDQVAIISFAVLIGWPALAPTPWMKAALPSSLLVAAVALLFSTGINGPSMQVIPWVAASVMLGHWALWRVAVRRMKSLA